MKLHLGVNGIELEIQVQRLEDAQRQYLVCDATGTGGLRCLVEGSAQHAYLDEVVEVSGL